MSASLVDAVRDRCIQPQVVHMTEDEFIAKKRETFKPAVLLDTISNTLSGEQNLDIRVGEPTFFYIILENPNENMRNRRTFTLQVCGERVESHVKLMTNFDEVSYWKSNGRLEEEVEYNGRKVRLLTANDLVENCILLNEVKVMGL